MTAPRVRGATNHAKGVSAELQVERAYMRNGARLLKRRWRGAGGEIDLIFCNGDEILFVEVKSSRTHNQALMNLSQRQMSRIAISATEFLDTQPLGSLTPMRMDVAMVDASGRIEILENALMSV